VVAGVGAAVGGVLAVTRADGAPVEWQLRPDGLELTTARSGPASLATVYRVDIEARDPARAVVTSPTDTRVVTLNGDSAASLHDALAAAQPGAVVTLGAGRYDNAPFPLRVPAGVTLRADPHAAPRGVVIDGGGAHVVALGAGSVLEGLTVVGGAPGYMFVPPTCVTARNADAVVVRHCVVDAISIAGGSGHRIEGNVVAGGNIVLDGTSGATVTGNFQHGLRWGVGIEVVGGTDATVEQNECHDDLCAIRVAGSAGGRVEHNRIETRWFAVHVRDATGVTVRRNRIARTMRAVSIEGGRDHLVELNTVERCDTGVLLERGATATRVSENWLHGCRVGILAWDDQGSILTGNAISEPREHAVVANTALATTGNDLGGGSIWLAPPQG
jgi:nitrous oxidase accessory protein NosD